MTVIAPGAVFDLHVARSDFIDAYNKADTAVRQRLRILKAVEKPMLHDNMNALLKIPAGPQYSKAAKKNVDHLVDELRRYQTARCDIVHSQMQVLFIGTVATAIFSNVQQGSDFGRSGLLLTLAELRDATARLEAVARGIGEAFEHRTTGSA